MTAHRKAVAQRVIIARAPDGVRIGFKPGDALPNWLTAAETARLVSVGAAAYVEPEPAPEPTRKGKE